LLETNYISSINYNKGMVEKSMSLSGAKVFSDLPEDEGRVWIIRCGWGKNILEKSTLMKGRAG
jgi:hypothetical protein